MIQLSRLTACIVLGILLGFWLAQPGDRMVGAVAHVTPCGVLGVVEVQADGDLVIHMEDPGPEFNAALEALPQEQLVVVTLPCPQPQLFPNQYEAQKQDRAEESPQARHSQSDGANRPYAG